MKKNNFDIVGGDEKKEKRDKIIKSSLKIGIGVIVLAAVIFGAKAIRNNSIKKHNEESQKTASTQQKTSVVTNSKGEQKTFSVCNENDYRNELKIVKDDDVEKEVDKYSKGKDKEDIMLDVANEEKENGKVSKIKIEAQSKIIFKEADSVKEARENDTKNGVKINKKGEIVIWDQDMRIK